MIYDDINTYMNDNKSEEKEFLEQYLSGHESEQTEVN